MIHNRDTKTILDHDRENVQSVRLIDSFFDGVPPGDVTYILRSFQIRAPNPLILGDVTELVAIQIPEHSYWDVTGLEFFLAVPAGAGMYTDAPDDFVRSNFVYSMTRNDTVPYEGSTIDVNGAERSGNDILNGNVLNFFGSTPAHVVFPGGANLKIQVETRNAGFLMPLGAYFGARLAARQVEKDLWEKVAR